MGADRDDRRHRRRCWPAKPLSMMQLWVTMGAIFAVNAALFAFATAPSWVLGNTLHRAKVELLESIFRGFSSSDSLTARMSGLRCLTGVTKSGDCGATGISGPDAPLHQQQRLLPWLTEPVKAYTKGRWTGGRGVVIAVGSQQAAAAAALVTSLREVLGSALPVEIFYRGDVDLGVLEQMRLERLPNVRGVTDLRRSMHEADWHALHAHMKPFAAFYSRFSEVVVLDADAVLLHAPEALFSHPSYVKTGTLFFRDRCVRQFAAGDAPPVKTLRVLSAAAAASSPPPPADKSAGTAAAWAQAQRCSDVQDGGVVVLDKTREGAWGGLLATMMLSDYISRAGAGGAVAKEAWWMGQHALGRPYAFVEWAAGTVGERAGDAVCASTAWRPLHLLNATTPSWFNGGLARDGSAAGATEGGTFTSWAVPPVAVGTVDGADGSGGGGIRLGLSTTPAGWASDRCVGTAGAVVVPADGGGVKPSAAASSGVTGDFNAAQAARIAALVRAFNEEVHV